MRITHPTAVVVLGAAIAVLTACGSDETTASVSAADGTTDLTVTVSADGRTTTDEWRLTCDPDGGDHPEVAGACALLGEGGADVLAPVPPDAICTEIYGGDDTATVVGTVQGDPVSAEFSRVNGCEIDRWDSAIPLLPESAGLIGGAEPS